MSSIHGHRCGCILWAWLLCLALTVTARAEEIGTVILKTGETYADVIYSADYDEKLLTIHAAPLPVTVPFDQVNHVLNQDGTEITDRLLSGRRESEGGITASRGSSYRKPRPPILWKSGIRFAGNYSTPSGTYFDGVGAGVGFEGDFLLALNRRLSLRFTISKSGLTSNPKRRVVWDEYGSVLVDIGYRATRFFVSTQVNLRPDRETYARISYFLYGGLGLIHQSATVRASGHSASGSESKFANTFGVGVVHLLSEHFGLDFTLGFDVVWIGREPDSRWYEFFINHIYAFVFDCKFGVVMFW